MAAIAGLVGLAGLVAIWAAGCGGAEADERPQLVVAAAASLREPLTECANRYQAAEVRLGFASTGEHAARIRQGAPPDVLAGADARTPEALEAEGLLTGTSVFATNELVLAVPRHSGIRSFEDLGGSQARLVVGSPSSPIGGYTEELLARLPAEERSAILARVRSREPDAKGMIGKLLRGAADAAFAYRTDVAAAGPSLRALDLPDRLLPSIAYAAGIATASEHPDEAAGFVEDVRSGRCASALREAGFGEPGP